MELTEQDSGGRRTVRAGEIFAVSLAENPTTGYRWQIEVDGAALLEVADRNEGSTERRGAGGIRHLAFKALRPGPTRLRLLKRRPWETQAVEEFVVDLGVEDG